MATKTGETLKSWAWFWVGPQDHIQETCLVEGKALAALGPPRGTSVEVLGDCVGRALETANLDSKKAIGQEFQSQIAKVVSKLEELAQARKFDETTLAAVEMVLAKQPPEKRVVISAGGEMFELTAESLRRGGGVFSRLIVCDAAQPCFLDISPDHFRALADYMRTGVTPDLKNLNPATFKAYCDKYLVRLPEVTTVAPVKATATAPSSPAIQDWKSRCSSVHLRIAGQTPLSRGLIAHFARVTTTPVRCTKDSTTTHAFDQLILESSGDYANVARGGSYVLGRAGDDARFDVTFPTPVMATSFRLVYGGSFDADDISEYSRPVKWSVLSDGKEIYRNEEDSFAKDMMKVFHLATPTEVRVLTFKLHEVVKGSVFKNRFAVKMLEVYGGVLSSPSRTSSDQRPSWEKKCTVVKPPDQTSGLIDHFKTSLDTNRVAVRADDESANFERLILSPYDLSKLEETCFCSEFKVIFPRRITITSFRMVYGGADVKDSGSGYARPIEWTVWSEGKEIYQNAKDDFSQNMCCLFVLTKAIETTDLTFKLHGTAGNQTRFAVKMLEVYGGY
jgi:hypothetical protein